ncbi:cytochrome P450 [Sphingomonas sp. ac-8]|uniref:cytochrome P450 n=1 Tax=Sphingomonas sp. ac-8 TaxID=3242977 RepID=UPI003A7F925F
MPLPQDPALDSTRAFFAEGYDWVGNRCRELGSDAFRARIMLQSVVCMAGEEAARRFYDGRSFTRTGAMPQITLRQLQDKGSVQALDGAAHRHRKQLFLTLLARDPAEAVADAFERRWQAALPDWRTGDPIVMHDAFGQLLFGAACDWLGVDLDTASLDRRTHEMLAMVDGAGTVGPRAWKGLALRRRAEHWARDVVQAAREGTLQLAPDAPLARLAAFRDLDGELLDLRTAGVELLNIVRPTVAVARFLSFAVLALHARPGAAAFVADRDPARLQAFAQEVRRFYPFFPVIGGRVRAPFAFRDHAFAIGDWVLLGLHATNHDPRLWEEPETFRPERFLNREPGAFVLVPQGGGDHASDHRCPGEWITLALLRRIVRRTTACRRRTCRSRTTASPRCRAANCA